MLSVSLIEPIWTLFSVVLPDHHPVDPADPLGCHRHRIPDGVMFDHNTAVLVHRSSEERIATLGLFESRHPAAEWIPVTTLAARADWSPAGRSRSRGTPVRIENRQAVTARCI